MSLRQGISQDLRSDGKIGERVAELRQQKGQTLGELGREVGVSDTCIWNWEQGNTKPRPGNLAQLVAGLGTTHAYLLRGERESSTSVKVEDGPQNLADIIREARETIASAAGLHASNVRITLDYGG